MAGPDGRHGEKNSHDLLKTVFPQPLVEIESQVYESSHWEGELVHRRRDGTEVIVSSRWALRKDGSGRPISILQSNRDVTRRKQDEEKFRNLLESAPDAMVIVNQQGRSNSADQRANREVVRIFPRRTDRYSRSRF